MGRVVVVGGGQAAASCVARLRAGGFDGAITLLCGEPVPPYQRPPLSKAYLLGEMELERLFLRPAAYYAEHGIELRTGARALRIDRARRRVHLADGDDLPYDSLLLATGAVPRRLPAAIGGALPGTLVMRDLADADALAPELVPGRRAVIVGGGYIGLEAAAVCAKKGLDVTLLEAAPRILGRVAAPETADAVRALHRAHGVEIREGAAIARLAGRERVEAVELSDGSVLPADFVLVGIGIAPDTALAEAAGLVIDNGIAVDAACRTSDPAILAAGDCASFVWQGRRMRLESVGNAIDMGETAADAILGREAAYRPAPWFWSDQYDMKLQIAGLNTGYAQVAVRDAGAARSHWYYDAAGRLLAVDAINDSRAYMIGKRLIEAGKSPAPALVTDPAGDLKALLKA